MVDYPLVDYPMADHPMVDYPMADATTAAQSTESYSTPGPSCNGFRLTDDSRQSSVGLARVEQIFASSSHLPWAQGLASIKVYTCMSTPPSK